MHQDNGRSAPDAASSSLIKTIRCRTFFDRFLMVARKAGWSAAGERSIGSGVIVDSAVTSSQQSTVVERPQDQVQLSGTDDSKYTAKVVGVMRTRPRRDQN